MGYNETFELNNAKRTSDLSSGKINKKSPLVEVFSYMAAGKDVAELNGKIKDSGGQIVTDTNAHVEHIKELGRQAGGGNLFAAVELNELRTFAILPLLEEELQLLSWMGQYTPVNYDDTIYATVDKLGGDMSRFQALGGDVVFPAWEHEKYPVATTTVSGGYQVDYRKIQFGDMTFENIGMNQVRIDIRNKASRYIIYKIWDSISNSTNVKFVSQGSGITQAALDDMVRKIRRFGSVGIFGDYSVVSQINGLLGYSSVVPVPGGVSQAAMDEIRKTGLIGMYNGATVMEIKNEYNLTKPLPTHDGFETYFPNGLLFVIPNGMQSPIRTWTRGGLTAFTGNDVATGRVMTRFDLEIACDVAKTQEYKLGIIFDNSFGPIGDPRVA